MGSVTMQSYCLPELDVIPGGAASPDDPGGPADPTDPWAPQFWTISVVAPGLIERIKVGPFSSGRNQRSFSKTPLALLESSQRPQEIDSSKSRPIYVRKIELTERTLP